MKSHCRSIPGSDLFLIRVLVCFRSILGSSSDLGSHFILIERREKHCSLRTSTAQHRMLFEQPHSLGPEQRTGTEHSLIASLALFSILGLWNVCLVASIFIDTSLFIDASIFIFIDGMLHSLMHSHSYSLMHLYSLMHSGFSSLCRQDQSLKPKA